MEVVFQGKYNAISGKNGNLRIGVLTTSIIDKDIDFIGWKRITSRKIVLCNKRQVKTNESLLTIPLQRTCHSQ